MIRGPWASMRSHGIFPTRLSLRALAWVPLSGCPAGWGRTGLGPQINSDPNAGGTRGGRVVHWQQVLEPSCLNYMKRLTTPIAFLNI